MVNRGLGLTALPFGAVQKEVSEGQPMARRIVQTDLTRTRYPAQAKRRPQSKARDALESLILNLVAHFVKQKTGTGG